MTGRPGPLVSLYLDHAKVGCGERQLVVLRYGRKHVRLFYWPTLTAFVIGRAEFDAARRGRIDAGPARIARQVEEKRRAFRRLALHDGGRAARDALALLRAASGRGAGGAAA